MLDPAVLPAFLAATFLVVVAPGPDNAYISAVAVRHGPVSGLLSSVGMAVGMVVHVAATSLGLAAVIDAHDWSIVVIKLAGGVYLARLAVLTFQEWRTPPQDVATPAAGRLFQRAVITNLTNPKVIIFFASFLPQFARPDHGSLATQLLALGAIFLGIGLVCDSAIGVLVGLLGRSLGGSPGVAMTFTLLAGAVYSVLAVLLVGDAARTLVAG